LAGKVIGNIPYVGHVILFLKEPIGILIIVLLTGLVIIHEFILPLSKKRDEKTQSELDTHA
jgi:hypothetical protein